MFTDTMEVPTKEFRDGGGIALGSRRCISPCPTSPEFPGVYLLRIKGGGYPIARLVPMALGGFSVRYDNPAYEGFTVGALERDTAQAVALIRGPVGDFLYRR